MGCEYRHIPVLTKEVIDGLDLERGRKTVIDATAGGMGHAAQIAQRLGADGRLVCIDTDSDALENNKNLITKYKCRTELVHDNFENILGILNRLNIDKCDAILADLGVSSYQIDTAERGFSYTKDAPLDMRMNQQQQRDAYHVVNNYGHTRLEYIIREFGEERYAKAIATALIKSRPLNTTGELCKVIQNAVPGNYYKTGGHPAKRTFQAIRIEVNRELEVLEKFVYDAVTALAPGGRLAIITFHSLEDRIVKQAFKTMATDCICPPKTPTCICGHTATLKLVTKKPLEASKEEIEANPRAASAKLRLGEKL